MRSLVRFVAVVLLCGPAVLPALGAFSSIHIFGDGACTTTTTSNQPSAYYWGHRYCNGRTWVEVLAQRQAIPNNSVANVNWVFSTNNLSHFNHFSSDLAAEINALPAGDRSNALFVVWVNDADFVDDMENIYPSLALSTWSNAVSKSLTNHYRAITNLYGKGVRTLLMPNAVDTTEVPNYWRPPNWGSVRQQVTNFNNGFAAILNQARTNLPGIKIYSPDFFTLLDDMVVHPSNYGLLNPGPNHNAIDDGASALKGPGFTNYIFWDLYHPSAMSHEIMADVAQGLLSPPTITNLTVLTGSNRLDVANMPLGLNGYVDGRTNLVLGSWTSVTNFISTNGPSVFVPNSGPWRFYRLRFPFAWTWP